MQQDDSYDAYVRERMAGISPVFTRASLGDFDDDVPIPEGNDAFTELAAGVQIMLDVIREKIAALAEANETLQTTNLSLSERRGEMEAIFANAGDGLAVVNCAGIITAANKVLSSMSGYHTEELVGKDCSEAFRVENEKGESIWKETDLFASAEQNRKEVHIEISDKYFLARKNGEKFPIAVIMTPIFSQEKTKEKNFLGATLIFRDITKEKEIDDAKSEFVSLASHQLQSPLSLIAAYAETLLSKSGISPEQKKYLEVIYRSSKQMTNLVNDFLDVSRLEMGVLSPEFSDVDIGKVIDDILEEIRPKLTEKKIRVEKDFRTGISALRSDPKLLRNVIQNLLANAAKYTPQEGMLKLKLSLKEKSLVFAVSDTGLGIPTKDRQKIFTKLFRASNARETEKEGTGLGLYIAKKIIDRLGGEIWFQSEEGKGSTFSIALPINIKRA